MKLSEHLENIEDFDYTFEILNMKGEKHGVVFKKGTIHYDDEKKPQYKSIVCIHAIRNKKTLSKKSKKTGCPTFFRFKMINSTEKYQTLSFEENHDKNHSFKIRKGEMTEVMIKELEIYNKTSKVSDIKEAIENKFKVELNFNTVHYQFRKVFPLLVR